MSAATSFLVRRETVVLPCLADTHTAPVRIAHLSDFHLWGWHREVRLLREINEALDHWQPSVLALTGDYADTRQGAGRFIAWMEGAAALRPICWVGGNHDAWPGRAFLRSLEQIPGAHAIDTADTHLASLGLSFTTWKRWQANPQPGSLVLLHNPRPLRAQSATVPALFLAGHLHGGQWTLWRDGAGRSWPASLLYPWCGDRWKMGAGQLIVSRGLGDTLPIRFGGPRELVMVDLELVPSALPG